MCKSLSFDIERESSTFYVKTKRKMNQIFRNKVQVDEPDRRSKRDEIQSSL